MRPVELTRIQAGTNTTNFRVVDEDGRRWFAKVYRKAPDREYDAARLEDDGVNDG